MLLLAAGLIGCNIGDGVPRCTLDPADLTITSASCGGGTATVSGTAFPEAECGVACPRPWTVTIRWINRTTGAEGAQPLAWRASTCWPFASTACGLDPFTVSVPAAPGTNDVVIMADQGDGYTACQPLLLSGC